eukprot:8672823-Pyramimonas_sp.AAC.1
MTTWAQPSNSKQHDDDMDAATQLSKESAPPELCADARPEAGPSRPTAPSAMATAQAVPEEWGRNRAGATAP